LFLLRLARTEETAIHARVFGFVSTAVCPAVDAPPPVNTLIKRTLGFLAIHWLEPTLSAICFLLENVWAGFAAF